MRLARKVLRGLCAMMFLGGGFLFGLSLQITLQAHLQASAAALASIGMLVLLFSVMGFIGAGREKSGVLMTFFFLNFFLITCLFVSSYAAFCFHDMLESWLKVHWGHPVLALLRQNDCCSSYENAVSYLENKFLLIGSIGFICIGLIVASLVCVVRIVTIPIVMKSLLTVINFIFILLGTGVFSWGIYVKSHDDMTAGQHWIALLFIITGTFIVALSIIGVIGSRTKSRTLLLFYIVGVGACLMSLLVCAIGAFTFSDHFVKKYDTLHTETIACQVQLNGCSNCTEPFVPCRGIKKNPHNKNFWTFCQESDVDSESVSCLHGKTLLFSSTQNGSIDVDVNNANVESEIQIADCGKCPEWSKQDIHAYVKSSLHLMGLFAFVVSFYIIIGFLAALILRKSLAGYQTDSI